MHHRDRRHAFVGDTGADAGAGTASRKRKVARAGGRFCALCLGSTSARPPGLTSNRPTTVRRCPISLRSHGSHWYRHLYQHWDNVRRSLQWVPCTCQHGKHCQSQSDQTHLRLEVMMIMRQVAPEEELVARIAAQQVVQQLKAVLHNDAAVCAALLPESAMQHRSSAASDMACMHWSVCLAGMADSSRPGVTSLSSRRPPTLMHAAAVAKVSNDTYETQAATSILTCVS